MNNLPYGGVMNWKLPKGKSVHDLSVHHGYRHIVAWGVHMGSFAYYIEMQCAEAKAQEAPMDAIFLGGSEWGPKKERYWRTYAPLTKSNPALAKEINKYVEAMEKMEERKK